MAPVRELRWRWGGCGHGASVTAPDEAAPGIVVPLVSFNLGVEVGQIVVAGLALPVIWKLRTNPAFVRRAVPVGSALVAATLKQSCASMRAGSRDRLATMRRFVCATTG